MFSSPLIQQILAKLLPVSAHSKSLDFFLVIALGYLYDFFHLFWLTDTRPHCNAYYSLNVTLWTLRQHIREE